MTIYGLYTQELSKLPHPPSQKYMKNMASEARRKPDPYFESSVDIENYDILVIGRTGVGKSATVDKLMVPNTHFRGKQTDRPSESERTTENETANSTDDAVLDETGELSYKNLRARVLSKDETPYRHVGRRIKNIDFCRHINEPHKEIDKQRAQRDEETQEDNIYDSTKQCELLTNEDSKIRVLDVPGFFSPHNMGEAKNTIDSNLATVRHIIHIQATEKLKFMRVVYFLPGGPLTRSDRTIQIEIHNMVKFFGRTIFRCMVLVSTIAAHISRSPDIPSETKFPKKEQEQCRRYFQKILVREFEERQEDTDGLPEPPIIFIAMTDTCEEILEKVMFARVGDSNYHLWFNSQTCCKCSIELSANKALCEYRKPGEKPWEQAQDYDKSCCHPKILPVHTTGSIARGLLKSIVLWQWQFTEEQCVYCTKGPGSPGCMKVNTESKHKDDKITVDHSNLLDN